ncbi:MAG: hypothetical protein ABRQ23_08275 [Syntrophomonadaceae bacterium]
MYSVHLYRIYETGQEIDIDSLGQVLPHEHMPTRAKFFRVRPRSIQMESPPLMIKLGVFPAHEGHDSPLFTVQAKIYDIGTISICLSYESGPESAQDLEKAGLEMADQGIYDQIYARSVEYLKQLLKPRLDLKGIDVDFYEDYNIYCINRADELSDPVPLLMGERVDFSEQMRSQVLDHRLSYTQDDFAIITWDSALICDPEDNSDLRDLIEFANVQLLELRYYDDLINRQMIKMYDDIETAGAKSSFRKSRYYKGIISSRMQLIADITEVRERIENLIKITEDVYYARVYQTTLKVLRCDQWTESLNRKLQVIQQNYSLLSNQVNIQHSNFLEWIIIILIALELGYAILDRLL